ncbi:lipid-A-disaccharide synthase N-terminal domain-containing protein [uncultured Aureimonas sp.]|uniref:lipid-A-disaccharide synthase N-terminal domain-containing protein n=1 Tax=uncultured Aureimonas sp. TaxID=1604662 RepID=UPI0025EA02BA|nr:lipid-A-disaccharide synthase N-terminal domain-containing protein [uncultured Aureimonas sp.]
MTMAWSWLHDVFVERFDVWLMVGLIAQAFFTGRFIIQWIASERARKSIVPAAFWTFSLGGGFLLLVYAIHREDPVFIIGQAAGLIVYVRNLMLIGSERKRSGAAAAAPANGATMASPAEAV